MLRNFLRGKIFCRDSFLLAVLILTSSVLFSQESMQISGTVTDSSTNEALQDVTVLVKGTKQITRTDANGAYSINAQGNSILIFQYVGFIEKQVEIGTQKNINISLANTNRALGEVVVVAYAKQKKATVTGAIASITTKEVKQSPAANLAVSLAGRLPGLTTIQSSGEPGRDATSLFIRGRATINQTAPIVLIDGVERDLTYIDPNEVESVTILKDASSTALFGVRGANGVILVTTKRGTSETPEINFSSETAIQSIPTYLKTVNSYEFASLKNLGLTNDGLPEAYTTKALDLYKSGADPVNYPNTNWRDIMMKNSALQQRFNLNISGATSNRAMRYFVNASYLNQGGQFNVEKDLPYDPSFKLDRYSFRSNIDLKLGKRLNAFLNVAGYLEKQNMPMGILNRLSTDPSSILATMSPSIYIMSFMTRVPAVVPKLTPDGDVTTYTNVDWPAYGLLNRSGYLRQTRSNVLASFGMKYDLSMITKGLSTQVVMSFDTKSINNLYGQREFMKFTQTITPNPDPNGPDQISFSQYGGYLNTPLSIGGSTAFSSLSNTQAFINYDRLFSKKHHVTAMILYQQQQNVQGIALPFNLRGFAGRATYGFDNKYFAEFNAGYNGSEQFAKGKRFGFFPAVSAGWLISNEAFFKDQELISNLKIRGSYGLVGNDQLGGQRFLYLDDIFLSPNGYSTSLGQGQYIGINRLSNPDITWEIAKKTNIGLELGLFNGISLVVDVFKEHRDNILRTRTSIPAIIGFSSAVLPPSNVGVIENKGYEIELNYQKAFSKDFSILTKLNFNHAKNKQIAADEPKLNENYAYRYRATGYPLGQSFGYIIEGYFKDQAEIANSPAQVVGGHASLPGDFKYADLNGDKTVNELDMAPIGYTTVPEYTYGAAFSVNYKQFDISVLFQGVANASRYLNGAGIWAGGGMTNYTEWHLNSWTPEKAASGQKITYPRFTSTVSPNESLNTFFYVYSGYVKLRNVEIGYNFPVRWLNKIGVKKVRIYSNGQNLFTWDKLPTNAIDPEQSSVYDYPIQRIINFGVNITF